MGDAGFLLSSSLADDERGRPPRDVWTASNDDVAAIYLREYWIAFGPEYGAPTTITVTTDTSRYDLRDGDLQSNMHSQ